MSGADKNTEDRKRQKMSCTGGGREREMTGRQIVKDSVYTPQNLGYIGFPLNMCEKETARERQGEEARSR